MKIIIILLILIACGFFVFEYFTLKKVTATAVQEHGDYKEQQKQVDTQTNNYNQKIEDINNSSRDAYNDLEY